MTRGADRMGDWLLPLLSLKLNNQGLLVCLGALLLSSAGVSDIMDAYISLQDTVISLLIKEA